MTDLDRIKDYAIIRNSNIVEGVLLDEVCEEVVERVLLYLNEDELEPRFERIVASVVAKVYVDLQNEAAGDNKSVAAVVDNGQEVRYHQNPTFAIAAKGDQELFGGFEKLLQPYRRFHAIAEDV